MKDPLHRGAPSSRFLFRPSPPEQHQRSSTLHQLIDHSAASGQTDARDVQQKQQSQERSSAQGAVARRASPASSSQLDATTTAATNKEEAEASPQRRTSACTRCSHLKVRCDGGEPCGKCISTDRSTECFYRLALKRGPPKGCPPRGGIRKKRQAAETESEGNAQHLQPLYDQHPTQQREPSYQATPSYFSPFQAAANNSPQAALRSLLQGESEATDVHHFAVQRALQQQQHEGHPLHSPRLPTPYWPTTDARRTRRALPLPHTPMLPSPGASSTPRFLSDGMRRYTGASESHPSMALRMPSYVHGSSSSSAVSTAGPTASTSTPTASPPLTSGDEVLRNLEDVTETRLFGHLITYILAHWPLWHAPTTTSLKELRGRAPTLWLAAIGIAAATADAPGFSPSVTTDGIQSPSTRSLEEVQPISLPHISRIAVDAARSRVLNEGLSKPTIETTQALLLITLVELGRGHMSSAWSLGGLACRIALDLRLNESNERDRILVASAGGAIGPAAIGSAWHGAAVIQEERRTFWCLYALDRVLSAVMEKPALLRLQDISQPLPGASERDEFDVWLSNDAARMVEPHALVHLEGVKTRALSSFRAWVGALKVLEVVQTRVYSRDARKDRSATRGAHEAARAALVEWTRTLPDHLRWDSPTIRALGGVDARSSSQQPSGLPIAAPPHATQTVIVAPHHLTMRAWWCLVCMFLYRPWVSQNCSDNGISTEVAPSPTKREALEICFFAATEICEITQCYESSYRSRKIPSSWPYLIFSAATTFAPLAGARALPSSPFAAQSGVLLDKCLASLERVSQTWQIGRYHMSVLLTLERSSHSLNSSGPASTASPSLSRRVSDDEYKEETPHNGNEVRRISAPTVGTAYSPSLASTNGGPPISPPLLSDVAHYSHAPIWSNSTTGNSHNGAGGGNVLGVSLPAAQGMGPALLSPRLPLPLATHSSASPRGEGAQLHPAAPLGFGASTAVPAQLPSAGSELWSLMPMAMPIVESDAIWESFMAGLAR